METSENANFFYLNMNYIQWIAIISCFYLIFFAKQLHLIMGSLAKCPQMARFFITPTVLCPPLLSSPALNHSFCRLVLIIFSICSIQGDRARHDFSLAWLEAKARISVKADWHDNRVDTWENGKDRGDLKAERRIISKRCMLQYIPIDIFRGSFKFFMGVTLGKKKEGGKRDNTFFSALYCANTFTNCVLKQFWKL
jgi:hypothetical protein